LVRTGWLGASGVEERQHNQTRETVGIHGVVARRKSAGPLEKLIAERIAINKQALIRDWGLFISSGT
jgi:hypothetical protein